MRAIAHRLRQDDVDNLCTLCGVHHRALHSGALRIEGSSAHALSFFHADGTPYGAALVPPQLAPQPGAMRAAR